MSARRVAPPRAGPRTPLKRVAVGALLVALALWPAVHHAMWRSIGFDAWMFFGWAMYAAPDPTVQVTVAELHGERADELALDPVTREAVRRWAGRRSVLGRALRPDELALTVGRAEPGVRDLWIRVRTLRLDRSTARLVPDDETFAYRRGGERRAQPAR